MSPLNDEELVRKFRQAEALKLQCPRDNSVMLVRMDLEKNDIIWECPQCWWKKKLSYSSGCELIKAPPF